MLEFVECDTGEKVPGIVVEECSDGRLAVYYGQYCWYAPCTCHDNRYEYGGEMTEEESFQFLF